MIKSLGLSGIIHYGGRIVASIFDYVLENFVNKSFNNNYLQNSIDNKSLKDNGYEKSEIDGVVTESNSETKYKLEEVNNNKTLNGILNAKQITNDEKVLEGFLKVRQDFVKDYSHITSPQKISQINMACEILGEDVVWNDKISKTTEKAIAKIFMNYGLNISENFDSHKNIDKVHEVIMGIYREKLQNIQQVLSSQCNFELKQDKEFGQETWKCLKILAKDMGLKNFNLSKIDELLEKIKSSEPVTNIKESTKYNMQDSLNNSLKL